MFRVVLNATLKDWKTGGRRLILRNIFISKPPPIKGVGVFEICPVQSGDTKQ